MNESRKCIAGLKWKYYLSSTTFDHVFAVCLVPKRSGGLRAIDGAGIPRSGWQLDWRPAAEPERTRIDFDLHDEHEKGFIYASLLVAKGGRGVPGEKRNVEFIIPLPRDSIKLAHEFAQT